MKIKIELNIPGDGRQFLNYWDYVYGNDVVCELVDGKLMLAQYDENSNELPPVEISIKEYIERVIAVAS